MRLAIATNPHLEKRADRLKLWQALDQTTKERPTERLDKVGFERFKQTIGSISNKINVK